MEFKEILSTLKKDETAIQAFKQSTKLFNDLPDEIKSLFISMDLDHESCEAVIKEILKDDSWIESIVKNDIKGFIGQCFLKDFFTVEQKAAATFQLNNFYEMVGDQKIRGKRRAKNQLSYGETDSDDHDSDYKSKHSKKLKKNKTKKQLLNQPQFRQFKDTIFSQCQEFIKTCPGKTATSSLREIKNQYFSRRLILGPFGQSDEEKNDNGIGVKNFIKQCLVRNLEHNILFVDKDKNWKADNVREGYLGRKQTKGKVIREDDPIGCVIIIGATARTFAEMVIQNKAPIVEKKNKVNLLPEKNISNTSTEAKENITEPSDEYDLDVIDDFEFISEKSPLVDNSLKDSFKFFSNVQETKVEKRKFFIDLNATPPEEESKEEGMIFENR